MVVDSLLILVLLSLWLEIKIPTLMAYLIIMRDSWRKDELTIVKIWKRELTSIKLSWLRATLWSCIVVTLQLFYAFILNVEKQCVFVLSKIICLQKNPVCLLWTSVDFAVWKTKTPATKDTYYVKKAFSASEWFFASFVLSFTSAFTHCLLSPVAFFIWFNFAIKLLLYYSLTYSLPLLTTVIRK